MVEKIILFFARWIMGLFEILLLFSNVIQSIAIVARKEAIFCTKIELFIFFERFWNGTIVWTYITNLVIIAILQKTLGASHNYTLVQIWALGILTRVIKVPCVFRITRFILISIFSFQITVFRLFVLTIFRSCFYAIRASLYVIILRLFSSAIAIFSVGKL